MNIKDALSMAVSVTPSKRQQQWFDTEFYAFIHFGVNTFTNQEWGNGNEDEKIFNPEKLDCDQWVEAIKSAGMKGMVLTAKHHDGFCLWPSKYTEHSVKNSPWRGGKGDLVAEAAEACRKGGIKFGIYLSPWDRNSQYYGTEEYNDYYCNQLTELLTNYGPIFHFWFDGACGEGPNGKKQVYDYDRYISLIRKYQPDATIFNDHGPDVRWCGNESGTARAAEWSVVPSELCFRSEVQTGPMPLAGDLSFICNSDNDLGSIGNILYSKGLVFCGSEIDMSIRNGWFWHKNEEPHSLDRLFNTYINSVGANCGFILNVSPTTDGLIDERDIVRLKELGDKIRSEFGENKAVNAEIKIVSESENGQSVIDIVLPEKTKIKYVVFQEDLTKGQRVESFRLYAKDNSDQMQDCYIGTCIGHKKICPIHIYAQSEVNTDVIRLYITASRAKVVLRSIELY
ncbi:MAG: alpha-L-fucosidase [Clostridia bacterium]|nr:alpha-L-fucosidase [Clostridia bacterium]